MSPVSVPTSKNEYVAILAVSLVLTLRMSVEDENVKTVESIVPPARVVKVYVTAVQVPELTVNAEIALERVVPATL